MSELYPQRREQCTREYDGGLQDLVHLPGVIQEVLQPHRGREQRSANIRKMTDEATTTVTM